MIVVADTSPLNYLVLIEQIELLPRLYGEVFIPNAVFAELSAANAPESVRNWIGENPVWLHIESLSVPLDAELLELHQGEAEAIALAEKLSATLLLIDEREGREVAVRRGLVITGLLGVLRDAAERGLIDLPNALAELQKTTFRASPKLIQALIEQHEKSNESKES